MISSELIKTESKKKELSIDAENSVEVFEQEKQVENLDPRPMTFLKGGHIDVPELANFNPHRELEKIKEQIKNLLPEERAVGKHILYDEFRIKLKNFRENLVQAQLDFENLLRKNQDQGLNWLYEETLYILKKFSVQSQEPHFLEALDKFVEIRENLTKILNEYKSKFGDQWEAQLFKALFGRLPRGEVKIEEMSINLYLRIYNRQDFILAGRGAEENTQNAVFGVKVAGASLGKMPILELNNLILIENSSLGLIPSDEKAIPLHEEEHAIHKLIPSSIMMMIKQEESLREKTNLGGEVTLEDFSEVLKNHFRIKSLGWERLAKSEILAYLKDGRFATKYIEETLLSSQLYDYFSLEVEAEVKHLLAHMQKWKVSVISSDAVYLNEESATRLITAKMSIAWNAYRDRISKAMKIVGEFIQESDASGALGRDQILRLLTQEPFSKWHRLPKINT